jgi:hypothetical protein
MTTRRSIPTPSELLAQIHRLVLEQEGLRAELLELRARLEALARTLEVAGA